MKKERSIGKGKGLNKTEKEFIAFGNKRNVFWTITILVLIVTLLGITAPALFYTKDVSSLLCIFWILELIYIWLYLIGRKK